MTTARNNSVTEQSNFKLSEKLKKSNMHRELFTDWPEILSFITYIRGGILLAGMPRIAPGWYVVSIIEFIIIMERGVFFLNHFVCRNRFLRGHFEREILCKSGIIRYICRQNQEHRGDFEMERRIDSVDKAVPADMLRSGCFADSGEFGLWCSRL